MIGISAIDYVNKAVSCDEGRYNMTGAYREYDKLIATDGHRLHIVSGLVNQEKGGFIDGRDAQFPCYEQVLPKKVEAIGTVTFTKKEIAHLNKVVRLFRDRNCGCQLQFKRGEPLRISATDMGEKDSFEIVLTFPNVEIDRDHTIGLNLRYFVEALIPNLPMTFSSEGDKGPQVLETVQYDGKYMAVVMPLKLDF